MPPRIAAPEPKQQRAHETRRRLLDAAVEELTEHGYAALTTSAVARRAGVSRGAQQNHFPHRSTLIAETVRHLVEVQIAGLRERVAAAPSGRARVQTALDIIFEMNGGAQFAALVELSLAMRGDPELRDVVARQERAVHRALLETANELFGAEVAGSRAFAQRWATVISAVRGLALLKLMGHPPEAVDRQWRTATRPELLALLPAA